MGADGHRRQDQGRCRLKPPNDQRAFFGRRKGPALRQHHQQLMQELLPRLMLDLARPVAETSRRLTVEIGFGGGEHLVHRAREHPETDLIGIEPFINGMAKALAAIEQHGLTNIRLHHGDAVEVLDALPEASVETVYLLYPDPWPKTRHWKRRFINPRNIEKLARILRPDGELRFASDWDDYSAWTLEHMRGSKSFIWTARTSRDWLTPWDGWPGTRYEAKALREQRQPCYLTFRRLTPDPA